MTSFISTSLTVEQLRIVENLLNEGESTKNKMLTMQKNSNLFWNMIGLNNVCIFMETNISDYLIQEFCINFIGRLIMANATKKATSKIIVGESGCLNAIVAAMLTHRANTKLQVLGYHVLAMAVTESPENATRVGNIPRFDEVAQYVVRESRGQATIDGMLVLGSVAHHNADARAKMHTLGVPEAIINIIRGNNNNNGGVRERPDSVCVVSGLKALGSLYLGKPRIDSAPKEAVPVVLEVMAGYKDDLVYSRGCYALAALASGVRSGKDDMIRTNAVDVALQLVSKSNTNVQVLGSALAFLNTVCNGYIPPQTVTTTPSTSTSTSSLSLSSLLSTSTSSSLSSSKKDKKVANDEIVDDTNESEPMNDVTVERIAAADGFKILARVIGKNTRVEKVQSHGCALLGKLARCKGTDYVKTVDLILTAMNKHSALVPVQSSVFFALSSIMSLYNALLRQQSAGPNSATSNSAVQMAMGVSKVRVGAIFVKPLFRAMAEFPASLSLQRWACAALMELGKHCQENKTLIQSNSVDLILRNISIATKNEQVISDALALLGYFTTDSTRAMIGSKHAMESLVPILDAGYAEPVVALCLKVTANIVGKNSSNRAAFRECGGIEATVRAITRFADSAAVTGRGAQALETAVDNCPPSKARIRECGGVPLLVAGIGRHGQVPKQLARIISAVAAIAANNAENTSIVVTAAGSTGVQSIIDTMNCWSQNVNVQRSCARALAALSNGIANIHGREYDSEGEEDGNNNNNNDNNNESGSSTDSGKIADSLVRTGVLEAIFNAMNRAQDDSIIQAYGLLAANALCNLSADARERLLHMSGTGIQHVVNIVARRTSAGSSGGNSNNNNSNRNTKYRDPTAVAFKMIADIAVADERLRRKLIACGGERHVAAFLKAAAAWSTNSIATLVAGALTALECILKPKADPVVNSGSDDENAQQPPCEISEEEENAIELAATLVVKFREYKDVVDRGVRLFAKLVPCGNDEAASVARACKAPEAILRSLRKHPEAVELQVLGLATLATLTAAPKKGVAAHAKSPSVTPTAVADGSLSSLRDLLGLWVSNDAASLTGSASSATTSSSSSSGGDSAASGGERPVEYSDNYLNCVLAPMRRYPANDEIQGSGCTVLRNLSRCNERYKYAFGSDTNDSAPLLVAAVKSPSETVAAAALRTLTRVTYCSAINCARILGVKECVRVITGAMLRHSASAQVQRYGWHTLANLANANGTDVSGVFRGTNDLSLVVAALADHIRSSALVTRTACYALAVLSRGSSVGAAVAAAAGGIEAVISGLEAYAEDEVVQRWGLSALNGITCESFANQKRVVTSGGIEALVRAIKAYPANEAIQEDGCATIGRVSTVDASAAKHVESSIGVRAIVRTITMYGSSAKIQEFALQALANISSDGDDPEGVATATAEICDSDGIEAIVASLKKFPANPSIVRLALLVLANVAAARSEDSKARLERCRGVEQVIAALSRHELDADAQRHGAATLSAVVLGSESVKRRVEEAGGIRVLVTCTLHNFPGRPEVLREGFLALANAADNSTRIQKAVEACGGLEAVLAEMDRHRKSAELQEAGLKALAAFTQFSSTAPAKIAHSKYGIAGVFEALALFGDESQEITLHATRTLTHMSGNANRENVAAIVRCGGVSRVLKLMGRYAPVARIQRYCIVILTNISLFPENTRQVVDSGAISALVAAMNLFKNVGNGNNNNNNNNNSNNNGNNIGEEVQRAGIIAIECIVTRTQNVSTLHIKDSGVIQAVVDGMASTSSAYSEYVLRSACVTFSRIAAGNAANSLEICSAGGIAEMLKTIQRYPENLEIQNLVINALGNIALSGGAEAQNAIWSKGGVEAVVQAMRGSIKNSTIQEQGCFALSTIAADVADIKVHAIRSGALVAIAAAMDRYGKFYEVQRDGCRAIARITNDVKMTSFAEDKVPDLSTQILSAMVSFSERKEIQRCGCLSVASVARGRKDAIDHFIDAGAPKVIVRAMGLHPTVVQVQEGACKALSVLASPAGGGRRVEFSSASNPSLGNIGGAGGSSSSSSSSSSGSTGAIPSSNSSGNFGNIGSNGGTAGVNSSSSNSACVDAVLGAMNRHLEVPGIQYHGCCALAALAQNAVQNQFAIGNGGGIETILRAATQFPDHLKLQSFAYSALTTLTSDNIPNLVRFCSNDGINVVATSMNRFTTDPRIQFFSLRVLFNTLAMEDGAELLGPHIYAIIRAAAEFTKNEDIEDLALWLIARMIKTRMNLEAAGCPECVRAVAAALQEHITSPSVRRNGCFIFSCLAAASREFALLIAGNGGIEAVLKAAAKDKTPETLGIAVHAIRDIARAGPETRREIDLYNGTDILIGVAGLCCGSSQKTVEDSCIAIEYILSTEGSEQFSNNVAKTSFGALLTRASAAYPSSMIIQQAFMCSRRELPQRTAAAIGDGFCSNVSLDSCIKPGCPWYCPFCNAPQWSYICETCAQEGGASVRGARGEDVVWCEVCWNRHHSGHKGRRVFIPCRCACTDPACQEMQLAYVGSKGVSRWMKSIGVEKDVRKIFVIKRISGKVLFGLTGKQIICLGVSVKDAIIIQDMVAKLVKKKKEDDERRKGNDICGTLTDSPGAEAVEEVTAKTGDGKATAVVGDARIENRIDFGMYRCYPKIISLYDIYVEQQKSFYMSLNNAMISSGFGTLFPDIQAEYERFVPVHPGVVDLLQSGILSNRDAISIFTFVAYRGPNDNNINNNFNNNINNNNNNNNINNYYYEDDDELSLAIPPYEAVNRVLRSRINLKGLDEDVELAFLNMQGYLLYLLFALRKLQPCNAVHKPLYCGLDSSAFDGIGNYTRIDETFVWPSFVFAHTSEEKAMDILGAAGAKKPVILEISGRCFGYDVTAFTQPSPGASHGRDILLEPETKFRVVNVVRDSTNTLKKVYLDIIKTPLPLIDQVKMFHLNGPIPEDWSSIYDELTNKIYYENNKTGFLQWKDPSDILLSDIFNF